MTQYGAPFDGLVTGDAAKAPYSAAEWARIWKLMHGIGSMYPNYGVFAGSGDGTYQPLEVRETSPLSTNVGVRIGAAMVNGRFYETDAVVTLPVAANASGNPRIDTAILRLDFAAQTIRPDVKQGSPGVTPVRPTMQQDTVYWEIPLADIAVANGFSTLAQSTITQRQRNVLTASFGWLPFAYPLVYSPAQNYTAAFTLGANGTAAIIPIPLNGNMLLQSVSWRGSGAAGSIVGWDLYVQDVNDGNVAENNLRRVAQSNGTYPGAAGGTINILLDALNPTPLSPGLYWLILQNRNPVASYDFMSLAANTFGGNVLRTKAFPVAGPGQNPDVVTGIVFNSTVLPAVRLNGRVFGETAAF